MFISSLSLVSMAFLRLYVPHNMRRFFQTSIRSTVEVFQVNNLKKILDNDVRLKYIVFSSFDSCAFLTQLCRNETNFISFNSLVGLAHKHFELYIHWNLHDLINFSWSNKKIYPLPMSLQGAARRLYSVS